MNVCGPDLPRCWPRPRFTPAPPYPTETGGPPRASNRYFSPARLEKGLVVSLGGVGGYNWLPRLLRRGLDEGGVEAAIAIYHWSVGPLGLFVADLLACRRNRAVARHLATAVAAYREWMPGRAVTLIGHSGGAGVAAWALEALPAGCTVDRVILLAPALSPRYNLSRAVRGVRHRLYVASSYGDVGFMGLGTSLFGTIDRKHGPAAGLIGFRLPDSATEAERRAYTRVRQIRWRPGMILFGHVGGHEGWTTIRFARQVLAPIVLGRDDPGEPMA